MITALCANPCVDRTIAIDKFVYGGMNRIRAIRDDGAGKGVNVALATAQLGLDSACVGFLGDERSELILQRLRDRGCAADFVRVPGAVRLNTKLLDRSNGVITEVNESGSAVTPEAVEQLIAAVVRRGRESDYIVLTGSVPPACPQDIYRTLIERLKMDAPGCRVVLDAEGEKMAEGLKAVPFMIKPNRYELELLSGRELPTVADIHAEALRLAARGIGIVAVSLGGDGAYCTNGSQSWFAPALDVPVRSTVGAGDSMVSGILLGLTKHLPLEDAFRYGVAAATSSVTTEGTQLIDVERFHEFIPKVDLRQVL